MSDQPSTRIRSHRKFIFVLVFVLGIAIYQINRPFSSLDTDKMNRLGDVHLLHQHH